MYPSCLNYLFANDPHPGRMWVVPIVLVLMLGYLVYQIRKVYIGNKPKWPAKLRMVMRYRNVRLLDELLAGHIGYYREMPAGYRAEFRRRTLATAQYFRWLAADQQVITEEMQLLISASAVQLLFGQPKVKLGNYDAIVLYNDKYYNPITRHYHKGEVNARHIVLAYNYFLEGYAVGDDKINLGLHEMAHALDLSAFLSQGKRYFLRRLMENFMQKTYGEYMALDNGRRPFLRDYGKQNMREFFAVAVEHFFEAPADMAQQMPLLYRELCLVLNQDPAAGIYRGIHPSRLPPHANQIDPHTFKSRSERVSTNTSPSFLLPNFGLMLVVATWVVGVATLKAPPSVTFLAVSLALLVAYTYWALGERLLKIVATPTHLVIVSPLRPSFKSIHLANIVVAAFESNLNNYTTNISYFENGEVKEMSFRAFITKASFGTLCNYLVSRNITVEVDEKLVHNSRLAGGGDQPAQCPAETID